MPPTDRMGAAAARRAALAAQGLDRRREPDTAPPDRRALRRAVRRLGLLQLDSVNVAVRAHYAPVLARLGPYDRDELDALAWSHSARRPRALVEYWAHEASLLPVEDWPLLRWRMRDNEARQSRWLGNALDHRPDVLEAVHATVAAHGPLEAGEVEALLTGGEERLPQPARAHGGWWRRSDVKVACEHLFAIGVLSTATRRGFRRGYDVVERVVPAQVRTRAPDRAESMRELVRRAADALGVATEPDLRDYYRLPALESRAAVAELVDAGELAPVEVEGWGAPAYRSPTARVPRRVGGRALLAPFDPLIWYRPRTERIFDFTYRIGIYTPAEQREHGYYVLPFLLDGELVARVDLKADRVAGVLRVPGAFAEPRVGTGPGAVVAGGGAGAGGSAGRGTGGLDAGWVAAELAEALVEFAAWQGLGEVVVPAGAGPFAGPLARALTTAGAA